MAKHIRQKIIIRNLTNWPQTLHALDGDTCLIPPRATCPINEKFTWQKLNPQVFRELTIDQYKTFGMTVHNIRGQHAQVQAMARIRQTGHRLPNTGTSITNKNTNQPIPMPEVNINTNRSEEETEQ